jgi:hypothetical protein
MFMDAKIFGAAQAELFEDPLQCVPSLSLAEG